MEDGYFPQLAERLQGPFALRLLLQPLMAAALAILDGTRGARAGAEPSLRAVAFNPFERRARLAEAWRSIGRVALLAFALDIGLQLVARGSARPLEAAAIALPLAVLPYILLRGPSKRARR